MRGPAIALMATLIAAVGTLLIDSWLMALIGLIVAMGGFLLTVHDEMAEIERSHAEIIRIIDRERDQDER